MDQPPATDAESIKTKNRPQQSCIKCRERKVKCDREKPCRSCIARGLQDECEYVRTNEDRHQISQADEIDSLRKELNRLKRRLADSQQTNSSNSSPIAARHDAGVTSTDNSSWPRKAQKRATADGNDSRCVSGGPYAGYHNQSNMGWEYAQIYSAQPSSSMGNVAQYSPSMMGSSDQFPRQLTGEGLEHPGMSFAGGIPNSSGNRNILSTGAPLYYAQQDPTISSRFPYTTTPAPTSFLAENTMIQLQQHPQANFWRGKQSLLQNIYKIIRDCDESRVPSVVGIVRGSESPEEAMKSIHRLLSTSRSPTASSSVPSETDVAAAGGGLPYATTTNRGSSIRSPSNQSSPE